VDLGKEGAVRLRQPDMLVLVIVVGVTEEESRLRVYLVREENLTEEALLFLIYIIDVEAGIFEIALGFFSEGAVLRGLVSRMNDG